MPTIPAQSLPSVAPSGASGTFLSNTSSPDAFGAGAAAALSRVGGAVEQASDQMFKQAQAFQGMQNETLAKDADIEATKRISDLQFNPQTGYLMTSGKNAVDGYKDASEKVTKIRDEVLGTLTTPDARRMADRVIASRVQSAIGDMSRHAAVENRKWQLQTSDSRAQTAWEAAALNYNDNQAFLKGLATANGEAVAQAELQGWDRSTLEIRQRQYGDAAWTARLDAWRLHDPKGALGALQESGEQISPKLRMQLGISMYKAAAPILADEMVDRQALTGNMGMIDKAQPTGDSVFDKLPLDEKYHVIDLANAKISRFTKLGDITEQQMEAQISTGIPADSGTLLKWRANLTRAGRGDLYNDYIKSEQEIQNVLSAPLADQARKASEITDDLARNGGDVKKIANVNRLKNAITANIKLANDQPVAFMNLRYGQHFEGITASDFSGPDAAVSLGTKLQSRFSALASNGLPPKALTSGEAQAFGNLLDNVDPKTAGRTFGMLRNASGNDDDYMSLMQQVGNGTKPEAYAGMIWAKQQSTSMSGGWFSGDKTLTADSVATTIVTGARLINQTTEKGDKTDKKQTSLFLPEDKEMQNQFASMVGDAFAGSPEAARNAFNMSRTYYAGRAAEKGVIARDKTLGSVNTDIMKEALAVTVGDVANIGTGKVISPYGMKASEFEQEARDQFIKKLPPDIGVDIWNRVTLKPVGNDEYIVMAGQQALRTNPDAPPMTLSFGNRDYKRDQFGRAQHEIIPVNAPTSP